MINVLDLDLGYKQCSDLHTLLKDSGGALISKLEDDISDLKQHWKGSDATTHINNLIVVHDSLGSLVSEGIVATSGACERIVAMQQVRFANGGMGKVGDELSKDVPAIAEVSKVQDTNEYNVTPGVVEDYQVLVQIHADFTSFISSFKDDKEELMGNWTEGANRSEAERLFNQFEENSETYEGYLAGAEANLATAVANLSKVMD